MHFRSTQTVRADEHPGARAVLGRRAARRADRVSAETFARREGGAVQKRAFPSPAREEGTHARSGELAPKATHTSYNSNLTRNLTVAFPIGLLVGDNRIVHRRLHVAGGVDCARGDAVLARRSGPVEMPEPPGEWRIVRLRQRRFHPGTIVYLHFDCGDRRWSPRHTGDSVTAVCARDPGRRGLEQDATDGCLLHDRFAVARFLAHGDIVAGHEAPHEARVAYFDPA